MDSSTATPPAISKTWFVALLRLLWAAKQSSASLQAGEKVVEDDVLEPAESDETSGSSGEATPVVKSGVEDNKSQNGVYVASRRKNRGKRRT